MLVEHARNLAGIADASHAEYGPSGSPVITLLECSLQDQRITVGLAPGSLLAELHGAQSVVEHTTCSYGLAPELQHIAGEHGIERVDHPFFVGTLYQPQLRSTPGAPHPIFLGLIDAGIAAR